MVIGARFIELMISDELKFAYRELSLAIGKLQFGLPITHVYNPLDYARIPSEKYLDLAGKTHKEVLFLGMNPGPWGMAQTGVPFGTVNMVRDWLHIEGSVGKPANEHPKRPVLGFDVKREEVSGTRFWAWARERFCTPDRFFDRFFVANYCPLVFMEESGKNRTPERLAPAEKAELFRLCDDSLRKLVRLLRPDWVIAIGKFAEDRVNAALTDFDVRIGRILHPSPASPIANRGWASQAEAQMAQMGLPLDSP